MPLSTVCKRQETLGGFCTASLSGDVCVHLIMIRMPMTEITIGDQTVRYDREATFAIYERLRNGWAEDCGCVRCRNLLAQRDEVYPPAFRELLVRLGIDPTKEAEAVADGPSETGLHHYCGWFFFVGEMVTAGEYMSMISESPYFGYFFT